MQEVVGKPDAQTIIYGIILILVLMFLPEGIVSIPEKIRQLPGYQSLRGRVGAVWGRVRP